MPNPASNLRSRKKLKKKQKKVPRKLPFNCSFCTYATCFQNRMVNHIARTHTVTNAFSCEICNFKTSEHDKLKCHYKSNHEPDLLECTTCEFVTTRYTTMDTHLKIHIKEQPYRCEMCEFRSSHQSTLLNHFDKHKCVDICFLCANRNASLRAFNNKRKGCYVCRMHTWACLNLTSLHLCVYCRKDCMVRWSYRRTTLLLTSSSKLFYNYVNGVLTCTLCMRTFKAKIGYYSHMQKHLNSRKCSTFSGIFTSSGFCANFCR